ncbi:MAG: hypothetical protein JSU80_06960 [Deltaproteobacteria bacterium]|nr:MAG: hypothetical protein JSU80_06960 [Deltaproteobacteria bacterium]
MGALFEEGRTYTFFFTRGGEDFSITGEVLSYEPPLVKIETEGLVRVINCSSSFFVEAVSRREDEESG